MRSTFKVLSLVAPTLIVSACLPHGKGLAGRGGSGESLVAAVDGIDQKDRENANVGFFLKCSGGQEIKGEGASGDLIRFNADASKVKDTETCWIEVRMADADAQKLDWEWFGVKKDKTIDVGLLYGSTQDAVGADRALTLTVYKLYSPKSPKEFQATVKAKFDGVTEGPAEVGTTAALSCLVGTETKSFPGSMKKDANNGLLADFTFKLDARVMKGVDCKHLIVMVDNKAAFAGELTKVEFLKPKKGDVFTFTAADDQPFLVKKSDGIVISTENGGICLNYDLVANTCLDVQKVKFRRSENFVVLKIKGKKGGVDGDVVTYLVGAGAGFELLKKDELKIADIKLDLAINEDAPFSLYEFSDSLQTSVLGSAFNADFVKGTAFGSERLSKDKLKDVTLLHIEAVWVHGFTETTEAALNAKSSAHWLAVVKATKDGQSEKEFIASGKDKYFHSASAPVTGKYFDFTQLVTDMKATGSDKWAVYGISGKAMATGCEADKAYYLDAMSSRHLDNLKPEVGTDAKLEACDVEKSEFDVTLEGATAAPTFWVWDWTKL